MLRAVFEVLPSKVAIDLAALIRHLLARLQRPEHQYRGDGHGHDNHLERQTDPPVITEMIPAGAKDKGVVLVPDGGEERGRGGDGDRHQERIGGHVQ